MAHETSLPIVRSPSGLEHGLPHLRVLVIDDSLTIRAMIEQLIERQARCRVLGVASNIEDARRMLADLAPNVVTLDLAMPGVDGFTFLEELRNKQHAPVVVVSGSTQADSDQSAKALAHGADACFDKARILTDARLFIQTLRKVVSANRIR